MGEKTFCCDLGDMFLYKCEMNKMLGPQQKWWKKVFIHFYIHSFKVFFENVHCKKKNHLKYYIQVKIECHNSDTISHYVIYIFIIQLRQLRH